MAGEHRPGRSCAARDAIERGDADARVAVTHVELDRFARRLVQHSESGAGDGYERDLGRGRLAQPEQAQAEAEAALVVATQQAVLLQGHGEAMGGGTGQACGGDQLRERPWLGLDRSEDRHGLVEHADTAYAFHVLRL